MAENFGIKNGLEAISEPYCYILPICFLYIRPEKSAVAENYGRGVGGVLVLAGKLIFFPFQNSAFCTPRKLILSPILRRQ